MHKKHVLEGIWNGSIVALPPGRKGRIAQMIAGIAPVATVCLTSSGPLEEFHVLPEAVELMPGASLGDVIAEELGIEVPYGALVVLEHVSDQAVEPIDIHQVECVLDRVLHDLLVASGGAREAAKKPAAVRPATAGFRDGGLNERFFRRGDAVAEDRLGQRAAL